MPGPQPSTAVVIAAYNAEATIAAAVRSALAQPEVAEVCVVDDASADGTVAAAEAAGAGDGRLFILRQKTNAGPSAARNAALEATTAPWICILDADDYLLPGRTATLLAHAGEADFIADPLIRVRSAPGEPSPTAPAVNAIRSEAVDLERFVLGNLRPAKGALELGYLKPLMRRSFLDRHAIRYRPDMRLGEDYELYARAIALGARFRLLSDPSGYVSVERAGSLSRMHSELDLLRLRDCDEALAALRPLTPGEARALRRHGESIDCRLQWRLLINAVKARDVSASIRTFRSPATALYLAARLGEQAWLRSWSFAQSRLQAAGSTR